MTTTTLESPATYAPSGPRATLAERTDMPAPGAQVRATAFDTRMAIETPENVTLTFDLAGPGSRMGAYFIDLAIRFAVVFVASWTLSISMAFIGSAVPLGMLLVAVFLLEWGYFALFEGLWRGRSPGKKCFGLRVIKDAGYPISFYDAVLRNLLRAADILPLAYGVGLVSTIGTRRLQRIGDLVAGTIVVRDSDHHFRRNTSEFDRLDPISPAECSGRFAVSERTLDVIEQLLWRRNKLPKRRVEDIAKLLAVPLARKLGYPLETVPGTSPNVFFLRRVLRTFGTLEGGDNS